ncbi:MAG TPA: hypothetical protein PK402_12765, partial [Tepidisphaeraceae bacterium]|nr:hypothetical protein [Tepidisphaeraceae bacterium]
MKMDAEESSERESSSARVHTPALVRARAAMRFRAKRAVIDAMSMAWRATGQLDRALSRPRVQVLVLHHVDDSMVDSFRSFIEQLSKRVQFVSYSRAIETIVHGTIDRPMITLSFDDGFASCVRAATVMEEFGAKVMFFVNPRIVGETRSDVLNAWRSRLRITHSDGFINW